MLIAEGRVVATGTPDELRRIAVGGDEVVIDTREPIDASILRDVPDIRRLEQRGPTQVRVTVADSSATLPDLVEAITAKGGDVVSAAETRHSFDEVFALLVERNRAERASGDDAGKAA